MTLGVRDGVKISNVKVEEKSKVVYQNGGHVVKIIITIIVGCS